MRATATRCSANVVTCPDSRSQKKKYENSREKLTSRRLEQDRDGENALHKAARAGCRELVPLLLKWQRTITLQASLQTSHCDGDVAGSAGGGTEEGVRTAGEGSAAGGSISVFYGHPESSMSESALLTACSVKGLQPWQLATDPELRALLCSAH